MTRTFEQWAESEGLDMSVDWKGELTSPVTAGALRGWEAAQSAGQEAIYQVRTSVSGWRDLTRAQYEDSNLDKRIVYAAPVNGGERELGQVIDERDQYHDAAEKLADAIAKHFGVEIGEHSNLNCPWQNALDHIAQATKRAADAPQVGGDERQALAECTRVLESAKLLCNWPDMNEAISGAIAKARAALSGDGGERKDAERLDFMIEQQAWVQWTVRDGSIRQCQVYTQDEDENYHILSGEDRFFSTPREAIDAAIAAKAKGDE